MLLIFKTNDLIRGIESCLNTRADASSFLTMSRYCIQTVYKDKRKKCTTWTCRIKTTVGEKTALFRLTLYELFLWLRDFCWRRVLRKSPMLKGDSDTVMATSWNLFIYLFLGYYLDIFLHSPDSLLEVLPSVLNALTCSCLLVVRCGVDASHCKLYKCAINALEKMFYKEFSACLIKSLKYCACCILLRLHIVDRKLPDTHSFSSAWLCQ